MLLISMHVLHLQSLLVLKKHFLMPHSATAVFPQQPHNYCLLIIRKEIVHELLIA